MKAEQSIRVLITGGSGFIGTNVTRFYKERKVPVMNFDSAPPRDARLRDLWRCGDLCDEVAVRRLMAEWQPTHLLHLAARTDLGGRHADDYAVNLVGAQVLLRVMSAMPTVKRAVFVSSMLVCARGYDPKNETDYCPTTLYGHSKAEMERIIRRAPPDCVWTILRLTSHWGPWFGLPYRDFFDAVRFKRFAYPRNCIAHHTYGFVGNTVRQLDALLHAENEFVHERMMYCGDDPPLHIGEWADEIASQLGYAPVLRPPQWIFRTVALLGDCLAALRVPFPMTSFRLMNLTTSNVYDLSPLHNAAAVTPITLCDGVAATLEWLGWLPQGIDK